MTERDTFESNILKSRISPWVHSYPGGSTIATHSHLGLQVLYAQHGDMCVNSETASCLANPSQVVLVPSRIEHEIKIGRQAEMATIYIENPEWEKGISRDMVSFPASPMLKQLIARTITLSQKKDFKPQDNIYLLGMLLLELETTRNDLHTPSLPDDKRALFICKEILKNPLNSAGLSELSNLAGASPRTINRIFQKHYGMTFHQWRTQIKLRWAEKKIQAGQSISEIACELGYASTSAFSYSFKKSTGKSPTSLLRNDLQQ